LQAQRVFDLPHYRFLNQAREALFREVLRTWKEEMELQTALDAGCGLGHFSGILQELGFRPVAFDGRPENIEEASRRFPGIEFRVADLEDRSVKELGSFDLVLCLGLLYHLENPFRCIRNLCRLTSKLLVIESMCLDGDRPTLYLRDEGPTEDQGLQHIAFYPTEACLAKMLYRAGFPHVYRFAKLPSHPQFRAARSRRRMRTLLTASFVPIQASVLALLPEPMDATDPWATTWGDLKQASQRLVNFVVKPWPEKVATLRRRLG